jgi:hypothetical protein
MLRLTMPRPRFSRRPAGALVVGVLVLGLGTAATAVTAELSAGSDSPAPQVAAQSGPTTAPRPSATATPVTLSTRPKHLVNSTLLVTQRGTLTHREVRALRKVDGVRRTQTVTAGRDSVDGNSAFVLGVDPQTFRPWTPKLTADSNALWASVSRGDLTASFDMGHNANLPLGKSVPVSGNRGVTPVRIGAFASVLPGVDAVISQGRARQIGLAPRNGLLISAPKADPLAVRRAALHVVGRHGRAELLTQVVVTRDVGEFLNRKQISGFLHAAASRVGAPYVWGAEGPQAFDCSGLVQWSFAQIGIQMPRVSQDQFFTGPHVPYKDARPGDLLFWHYDPTDLANIDHVAIYVGNGKMLVAPHTGELVQLARVPLSNLAGVVRVDPALARQIA